MHNIEDLIEHLFSLSVVTDRKSKKVIKSLDTQTRHILLQLTSGQQTLATKLLTEYASFFDKEEFNYAITRTRHGIRELDKTQWIRIIDNKIAVYFAFSTKILKVMSKLKLIHGHRYHNRTHYFPATAINLSRIVKALSEFDFEIEQHLQDAYAECVSIEQNKEKYLPTVAVDGIQNLQSTAEHTLVNELGEPDEHNIHLFQDRSMLYGLHVNQTQVAKSLSTKSQLTGLIACREKQHVNISPEEFSLAELFESLIELKRFPMMIVLTDNEELEQLTTTYNVLKHYVPPGEITVLTRFDNQGSGKKFNDFIKSSQINNSLDNTINIIYNKTTLQKSILKEDYKIKTVLLPLSVRLNRRLECYTDSADLIVHYDTQITMWRGLEHNTQLLRRTNGNLPIKNI